jgi:hypothetical protein
VVQDGLVAFSEHAGLPLTGILRRSLLALHRQGLSLQARSGKMVALYKYLASGDFADQIKTAENLVADLRTLDARERDAHEKVWSYINPHPHK